MAHSGDLLESASGRERVVFRRTCAETAGALLELDFFLKPGETVIAPHFHPAQEERFVVRAGVFRLRRGDEHLVLHPGDCAVVPPGVTHHLKNDGNVKAHAVVEFRPALGTEALFECLFAAAQRANTRFARWLAISSCLSAHPEEIRLAGPPQALLRLAARVDRISIKFGGSVGSSVAS